MLDGLTKRELEANLVLWQYGRTMLHVQIFESTLAGAWLMLPFDVDRSPDKDKITKKARHAIQRASPSEARDALAGYLPADLMEDVSRAVEWRNTLAHAFLRERLRNGPEPEFKDGTQDELEELRVFFERVNDAVVGLIRPRLDELDGSFGLASRRGCSRTRAADAPCGDSSLRVLHRCARWLRVFASWLWRREGSRANWSAPAAVWIRVPG